jgi:putative ABC transport system permease protein
MTLFTFALKSLAGRRRRFFFLGLAVSFGFFIMTVATGLTEGLLKTVREKGAFYFSGNVNITCDSRGESDHEMDAQLLRGAVREALGPVPVFLRSIYYGTDAQLFFGGATVRQRRVIGIDWSDERGSVGALNIVSGSFPADGDLRAVLISETAAKRLGVRVGDELMLLVTGQHGRNTANFVLRGVFKDSSIFGYAAYVSRSALNDALSLPAAYATDFGVTLRGSRNEGAAAERIRASLAKRAEVFSVAHTRAELSSLSGGSWQGKRYMVCTLDAHLSDIKQVLDAITAICYALLAAFLAVVLIGIVSTYRVVVYQRSAEIGMMRAIGMGKARAMFVFVEEAGALAAVSAFVGLIAGEIVLFAISLFEFPPSLDMFLKRGHLDWALDPGVILGIFAIVCASTLLAAWIPARKAAGITPMDAMRTEE